MSFEINLLGIFEVGQDWENLPGKIVVRHSDLLDLLARVYIRPAGSTATDFEIKDRTRGLTVRDVDRSMTVTPRRKMRVR